MGNNRAVSGSDLVALKLEVSLARPLEVSEEVFVAGSDPGFGSWKPDRVRLRREASRRFSLEVLVPRGKALEFKITRGSWKTQAIYDDGGRFPPDNRLFVPDGPSEVRVKVIDWLDRLPVEIDPVQGELQVLPEPLPAKGLNYRRDLLVWLPPSYRKRRKRFPVLYMHDGQNLFDPSTSFTGQDWKVDETASRLMEGGKIRECIIVGVPNSPDRMEEYNLFRPLGQAYARFLAEEVKPFIDKNYRTLAAPDNTVVMGSSMGGLISFQLVWQFPEVFSGAGCLSSAFYKSRSRILGDVSRGTPPSGARFYLDVGEHEPPLHKGYFRIAALLREKGLVEGENLMARFFDGATHSETAWSERLHIPLAFFFG